MPTRTPEEILAAIEEQAADDEMESVLAMTPEQRRDELRAAGFDLDAGDAEADKVHAATLGPASSVTAIRRRTPLRLVMIAAAAIALVLAAFTVMAVLVAAGETVASPNLDLDEVRSPSNVTARARTARSGGLAAPGRGCMRPEEPAGVRHPPRAGPRPRSRRRHVAGRAGDPSTDRCAAARSRPARRRQAVTGVVVGQGTAGVAPTEVTSIRLKEMTMNAFCGAGL